MATLTKKTLRSFGFINAEDFRNARGPLNDNFPLDRPAPKKWPGVPRPVPYITYYPSQAGRAYRPASWKVWQRGVHLQPVEDVHWRDGGFDNNSTPIVFTVYRREQKQPQFEAALAWAREHFGVEEWKKDPYGDWLPAVFVDERTKQLKQWINEVTS